MVYEALVVLWSIRSSFARSLTNEKACNCLLRTQTCDHIGIMKQYDMTVGPISQIILDQIKFGPDGPGAVKFDSNRLFCKLCSPLIMGLSAHCFCLNILCSGSFSAPLQLIKSFDDNKIETKESI